MSPSKRRRRGRRRGARRGLRLRDRFFQPGVARAITSPAGIVTGSVAAGTLLASGAHPVLCAGAAVLGWGVPVLRAMQKVPGLGAPDLTALGSMLPFLTSCP